MSLRTVRIAAAALTGVVALISPARATFFSFASDVNHTNPTFAGTAGTSGSFLISDFSRPNTFSLMIDDNNGPLPSIAIPVEFRASLTANSGTSTQIAGSLYRHTYRVNGTFGFYDSNGVALVTAMVGPGGGGGVLTVPGTQTGWSSAGGVMGSDSFTDVTYTATAALVSRLGASVALAYGITAGNSINPDDFGFTMTLLGSTAGGSVGIDPTTKAPTSAWRAEASFSGVATIPTPGAAALAALAGLFVIRRRRAA